MTMRKPLHSHFIQPAAAASALPPTAAFAMTSAV
jgi:hypothetical protein